MIRPEYQAVTLDRKLKKDELHVLSLIIPTFNKSNKQQNIWNFTIESSNKNLNVCFASEALTNFLYIVSTEPLETYLLTRATLSTLRVSGCSILSMDPM